MQTFIGRYDGMLLMILFGALQVIFILGGHVCVGFHQSAFTIKLMELTVDKLPLFRGVSPNHIGFGVANYLGNHPSSNQSF
ncbi:hypothetical protein JR316_0006362 [Psilocybe cubensis]|uniref:Uncharacterized protein n=1 Tax=Psilocybe cubensis TaxID=181762 RepID=A0ACB8H2C8_PSICU|nr:hypothetical protein JR316_0006362 [Psilocybe cubensis]KAH9481832.1 hypothetical protein JR316_0006362 [Psilocybe cubensis]